MEEERDNPRFRWIESEGSRRPATLNLAPGIQVYGERLVMIDDKEYRIWDAYRSKLAASLIKGLKELCIKEGSSILYLGVSTGTTASHVSDLIGEEGVLYGVEVSARVAREFVDRVAKPRVNVIPIIADARYPERYFSIYGKVDVTYCDIAQPNQTEIAIANCKRYLKGGGRLLLVVKTRSIDVTKKPEQIVRAEEEKLHNSGFRLLQTVNLEPFQRDHSLIDAVLFRS